MKMILQENALESWALAISYCDEIIAGKATLSNKKHFVVALQNSIELFVKQQMLNIKDYRVAKIKQCGSDGEPSKSYFAATDLNQFFFDLSGKDIMKKFYTLEFNTVKEIQKELFSRFFNSEGISITKELNVLQILRNDETHFYISENDFLDDIEFQELHNMMIIFYKILKKYSLLPFIGEAFGKYKRFRFERKPLKNFSFKEQLRKSKFIKTLKNNIETKVFPGSRYESYEIAEDIICVCDEYSESDFDEIWAYIHMLLKYKMLEITDIVDENVINGEKIYELIYREYKISI